MNTVTDNLGDKSPINPTYKLTLQEFSLQVFIGCHDEEREHPQEVRLQIELRSSSLLQAAQSDQLDDTFCYASLLNQIREFCLSRHFNLVEHLAFACHEFIKKAINEPVAVHVCVHKVAPPVDGLNGGVVFEYGELIP